jgi:hypothetical protein
MRKLTFMIVTVALLLLLFAPATSAAESAYSGVNTTYNGSYDNVVLTSFVNIPYTMEDVAYPETLFYTIFFSGLALILFGFWITSRPDYIASYTLIGVGISIGGLFAILAYMTPLVATHTTITLLNASRLYNVLTVTYIFSPWVSYAMAGGVGVGIMFTIAGVFSMYRTNKEKSIEQSISQDGDPIYKGKGKRYEKE